MPVGLFGLQSTKSFVRGVSAFSQASRGGRWKPSSARAVMGTRRTPARAAKEA